MRFSIRSSDDDRLNEAIRLAAEYADRQTGADVVGIAFLGAITRGYYDSESDIDITVFKRGFEQKIVSDTRDYRGFMLHEFIVDYDNERSSHWELGKRWAYSTCSIYRDTGGLIAALLDEKASMKEDERRWLIMSGTVLSEWYCNRLTELWIKRGDLMSAHHMIAEGLNHFFNALFALNGEITPDHKWRLYCSKMLPTLPDRYEDTMAEVMMNHAMDARDLERRKAAFMDLWSRVLPSAETYLGMKYDDFKDKV